MKKTYIFILTAVLLLIAAPTQAQSGNTGANFLVEIGERELENGNIEAALHEFSKALMLDPNHPQALEYVRRHGLDRGLYGGIRTNQTDIVDMAGKVVESRAQVQRALDEQSRLLAQQAAIEERLQREKELKDNISRKLTKTNLEMYDMRSRMAKLECMLDKKEAKLHGQAQDVKDIYAQINRELDEVQRREFGMEEKDLGMVHAYENELLKNQMKLNSLREKNFAELARRDQAYQALDDYRLIRHKVINDLKDELIYQEVEIMHKERDIIEKLNEIESLNDRLLGTHEQIDNKDELLEGMHEELRKLRRQRDQAKAEYQDTARELEKRLKS